ncbi:MAG: hypothetical protein CVT99_15755 [Bacteroidetes bacterium HGW-Bacteroidetes-16]|jgi:hypothetical protein|nr:MAG: hypothetical protein CVT99_15755 [Bacteroidetes bacterium HGW-Bacteroidetes-16]
MNRYTETSTLLAGGHQFKNWSLTYRVFTLICSGWETGYRIAGVFVGMRYVKKMNWVKTLRNPAPNFAPIADKQIMIIIKIIIICTPA